jgi:hypothetical protein
VTLCAILFCISPASLAVPGSPGGTRVVPGRP